MHFDIQHSSSSSLARSGVLHLDRGSVPTPYFMTIGTLGTVKSLSVWDLARLDSSIILGNTYHLWLRPGLEVIQAAGGLHQFNHWNKPILTDSGGFQAFSLSKFRQFTEQGVFFQDTLSGSKHFLSPEVSMGIQTVLGSDIALVLDECLEAEVTFETAKAAMERTHRWAKRCKVAFEKFKQEPIDLHLLEKLESHQSSYSQLNCKLEPKSRRSYKDREVYQKFLNDNKFVVDFESLEYNLQLETAQIMQDLSNNQVSVANTNQPQGYERVLFGIPQGAQFADLRKESALLTMELDFPGYSIGGVANGGEPEEMMYRQVLAQTELLEAHKPRHLLGVGTPKDIIEMVKRGIDLFDCVYPTRNARHGSLIFWQDKDRLDYETVQIKNTTFEKDFSPINKDSKLIELREYSKSYLRHLFKVGDPLALRLATLQNLEFYYQLMNTLREQIKSGHI
jgi:queuine tRNA-ribosyltransferase